MHRRHALIAALVLAASAAPAAAVDNTAMRDARYCEIFLLQGTIPDARAEVYNSIGRGTCPQANWDAIDPQAIKEETGAAAVILNGPRHFLMDSVTGAQTGAQRTFGGIPMTRVAAIPVHSAADLDRSLYADRTIARKNVWRWKKGRRVFELVAPGGDTYVMQSYAQIVDASLTLADLGGIGPRLTLLPDGWRYRTRILRRPLALGASGKATILQDDLQNTYQLATTTRPAGKRTRRALHIEGRTRTVPAETEGTVEDHGTLSGTPFGKGTIVLVGKLADGRLTATVRLRFAKGEVVASVEAPFTVSNGEIDFVGTGKVLRGTGAYRGVTGSFDFHDHNTLDGQNGVLEADGFATY